MSKFLFYHKLKHWFSNLYQFQVVGNYVFSGSSDGTARAYDLVTGKILMSYSDQQGQINCVQVLGTPSFSKENISFQVVTGSSNYIISVFDGKVT